MLTVKFQGGLGNQMFQYALYKSLSENNEVYADLSAYRYYFRPFMLEKAFGIVLNEQSSIKNSNNRLNFLFRLINRYILKHIDYRLLRQNDNYFIESPEIRIEYYVSRKDGYLDGYWQSEKYFYKSKNNIISDFNFIIKSRFVLDTANVIRSTSNSTSLHWRRGDYVGNSDVDFLTPSYFYEALKVLKETKKITVVFVFTEDKEWVEEKLLSFNLDLKFVIVSKELTGLDDYNEMYLMTVCEHNIISNSSFSWWGAYLNKNSEKTVVSPGSWSHHPNFDLIENDRVPSSWLRIKT